MERVLPENQVSYVHSMSWPDTVKLDAQCLDDFSDQKFERLNGGAFVIIIALIKTSHIGSSLYLSSVSH